MALSGTFQNYPVSSFGLYCEWSGVQSVTGNYTDVTLKVYLSYYTLEVGARSDSTISINGVSETYTAPAIDDYSSGWKKKLLKTKTVRVSHNADGTKSGVALSASWRFSGTYSGVSVGTITASTTVTLNSIDRTPPTVSCTVSNITANGFRISAASSATADQWFYSLDNGGSSTLFSSTAGTSASITLSNLSPNTTYYVRALARKKSNQVYGESGTITVKTLGGAVLLSCGSFSADAASISIIGAADGPTSILVSQVLHSSYVGPIAVAAYSYMALVPIIQPFAIKLVTTKKERRIRMPYNPKNVSRTLRICFPILVTIIAGFIAPMSVSLVGFLMFGNLLRECGCLDRLSETAQNTLANLITLLLGITISFSMRAEQFVNRNTLIIMGLGLVAFVFDSIAGVMFAKLLNLFSKKKVNPMVGAAGISAFPMSARVIQKMGLEADPQNHLLMHAVGANVAGQIASVLAGGMILNLVPQLLK